MIQKIVINGTIELGVNSKYTLRRGVQGLEMGVLSNADYIVPQSHSSRRSSNWMHSRIITMPITVKGVTVAQLLQNRKELSEKVYAKQGQILSIVITDSAENTYQLFGYLEQLDLPADFNHLSKGVLSFKCDNALIQSTTLKTATVGVLGQGGGIMLPFTLPITFPAGSGSVSISNAGTFSSIPDLIITGPGTNFTVRNITTGETLRIGYTGKNFTLTSGQQITISGMDKSITQAGVNKYGFKDPRTNFLSLAPGENEITLDVESGGTDDTEVQFQWRDSFLGI